MDGVSIVLILHKPNKETLLKIDKALKIQDYKGKKEIIRAETGGGLAHNLNYGIRKAKYEIIVSLHQDCIPSSKDWLRRLIEQFKDKNVVASVSKVELPEELWDSFDTVSKILSEKEQRILTPLMDEKGCAYRKSIFLKTGLFDEKYFRTAGEDFDMYLKLKRYGRIAYPNAKVKHYHNYNWKSRLKKELQLSNGFGALVRIHGKAMPKWYIGGIKAVPFLGYPLFIATINFRRLRSLAILAIPLYLLINLTYSYGFWKGFLRGNQNI